MVEKRCQTAGVQLRLVNLCGVGSQVKPLEHGTIQWIVTWRNIFKSIAKCMDLDVCGSFLFFFVVVFFLSQVYCIKCGK